MRSKRQTVSRRAAVDLNRLPGATYRLQFNRDFGFRAAAEIVDYLRDLGITDCYASPLFKAAPGSTHGYDICGFDELNPGLGGADDFQHFSARLKARGMGLLLDMVPNHMGNDLSNGWWRDVLEHGRRSRYASWFDVDWRREDLGGRVLVPILEDHYGKVLEAGKLRVVLAKDGSLAVAYYDRGFPLCPDSVAEIISGAARKCACPPAGFRPETPEGSEALKSALREINGRRDDPGSFEALDQVLRRQNYRLAYWRVGPEEINYRRFFDVTGLVSLRMERRAVFDAAHQRVFPLLKEGVITGLRIDHPDGLWNPAEYFRRLQSRVAGDHPGTRLYVVAEKILTGGEPLPADWPIEGTTGYDFLNRLNGLFIDGANREAFDRIYERFLGRPPRPFAETVLESKRLVLRKLMISELSGLTRRLKQITTQSRHGLDFSESQLRRALGEVLAAFPVYRTYMTKAGDEPSAFEQQCIGQAIRSAAAHLPGLDPAVWTFIESLLMLRVPAGLSRMAFSQCRDWVMRFQQLSGPVTAKGLEDTAFYHDYRFVSLNEVGGDPGTFGTSPEEFHRHNSQKAELWPHALLATATHDTKRGEDVRARLNVLSEMPEAWEAAVGQWRELNRAHKTLVRDAPAPDSNDEYLIYQTLVGSWPFDAGSAEGLQRYATRISSYLLKCIRESKTHGSWTDPDAAYEQAAQKFVAAILNPGSENAFLQAFSPVQRTVAFYGMLNSLGQVLIKATSPGVPDFYQGCELWDLSLVDPDNRRPVDYDLRRRLLAGCRAAGNAKSLHVQLSDEWQTGQIKLFVTYRALQLRKQNPELFAAGSYVPVSVNGAGANHVCAFARVGREKACLTVVPRLTARLMSGKAGFPLGEHIWQNTKLKIGEIPHRQFRNCFTGDHIQAGDGWLPVYSMLGAFPLALLESG
jgi:(1->4)-alpha-D-glucan 1-alpha-D-glucosylmutase